MNHVSTDFNLKKANRFLKNGRLEEASSLYSKILQNFPQNKFAKDGLIKIHDSVINKHKVRLFSLYENKKFDQLIQEARVLSIKNYYSIYLWNILGYTFFSQDKLEEAIVCFQRVLDINPIHTEAYDNIGQIYCRCGAFDKAIENYEQALRTNPNYSNSYNNLGVALNHLGYFDKAIENFRKAVKINPHFGYAYNNMGISLGYIMQYEEAIKSYKKALEIQPNNEEILHNIGKILSKITVNNQNEEITNLLCLILDRNNIIRPSDISKLSLKLIKFESGYNKLVKKYNSGDLNNSFHEVIKNLSDISLLSKLMKVLPLPDLELEKMLTFVRRSFLLLSTKDTFPSESLKFLSDLALQCFTNEYIYPQEFEESKKLKEVELLVKEMFISNKQPSVQLILCLASYNALQKYNWSHLILNNPLIEDVLKRQAIEPLQEFQLKQNMPILEDINNKISLKVKEQYEKNPYPRWINLSLNINAVPISKLIFEYDLKVFNQIIYDVKNPEILIAGCGTGQQVIERASHIKNSSIFAIDLSLSSLAYAKRKTNDLNIKNVKYAQSDILNLGNLKKQFDIIECVGVLHHMDNPMAGWKVLIDRLKPGGLMKIGLYSEKARKNIVKLRKKIKSLGIETTDKEMKSFRQEIINSSYPEIQDLKILQDFYSLSMFRDLLFHVQEHRFTISKIQNCLYQLGLNFCGFENKDLIDNFKLVQNSKEDIYDLNNWEIYEEKNPSSFIGMYQFWCQKP